MEQRLLLNRKQAADTLGCSVMTVVRLEQGGSLTPIKLTDKPNASTYYARDDIEKLVAGLVERSKEGAA